MKKLPLSIKVILEELRKLRKKPVSEDELRRGKDFYLGQLYLTLEDTLDQMIWLGEKAMYLGRIPLRTEIREEIEKITADDLREIARRYLKTSHLNLAIIGPTPKPAEARIRENFCIE